jgi:hypothetical protein
MDTLYIWEEQKPNIREFSDEITKRINSGNVLSFFSTKTVYIPSNLRDAEDHYIQIYSVYKYANNNFSRCFACV